MTDHGSGFEQLTWEDLTTWAGTKILSRGKTYKRQVTDLRLAQDGRIVAWVHGTRKYATAVRRDSSGTLSAVCSCPYGWSPCKHSVAVILAYLDAVKNKKDVHEASEGDRRLELIKETPGQEDGDMLAPEDEDAEIGRDFRESDLGVEAKGAVCARRSRSAPRRSKRADVVRQRIESMDRDQLVEFVIVSCGSSTLVSQTNTDCWPVPIVTLRSGRTRLPGMKSLSPLLGHADPYDVEIGHSAPALKTVIVGVCRIAKIDKPSRPTSGSNTLDIPLTTNSKNKLLGTYPSCYTEFEKQWHAICSVEQDRFPNPDGGDDHFG
jgi:hypothetical protein